jgi:hypothetical protein
MEFCFILNDHDIISVLTIPHDSTQPVLCFCFELLGSTMEDLRK